MSASSRRTQPTFTGDRYTIREALSQSRKIFPLLVKTCGQLDFRETFKEHCDKLPIGDLMLIEQVKTIEYALVRVLDYHSEDNVSSEKGEDFVLEHNNYVGNQYLMPLKCKGAVRLTSPPGCRNRYACVSQVLEDLPQYLIVNVDTEAMTPGRTETHKVVSAGHRLTVVCDAQVNKSSYLKCTDDNGETFLFKDNAFVNFTGDYSKHEYSLFTASKTNLPRCILFENVDPADVVIENDNQASVLMVVASGPLKILKVKKRTMLIAWLRNKENKAFRIVLIPEGLWDIENVQLAKFPNESDKDEYIDSRFWPCNDSSFVVDKLYLRQENKTSLTYLKSPALVSGRINISLAFSSDEESNSDDYEFPSNPPSPPLPLPERVQHRKISQNEGKQLQMLQKQDHGQQEQQHSKPKHQQQEKQKQPEMTNIEKNQIRQNEPKKQEKRNQHKKQLQSTAQTPRIQCDVVLPTKVEKEKDSFDYIAEKVRIGFDKIHNEIRGLFQATTEDRSLKPGILKKPKKTAVVQPRRASDSEKGKQDTDNGKRRSGLSRSLSAPGTTTQLPVRKPISLPSVKDDDSEETELEAHVYDELDLTTMLDAPGSLPTLGSSDATNLSMAESDTSNLEGPKFTREHFYSYSVAEVCECFKLCRLNDLAKICMSENLDGNFFKDSDLDFLSEPPFNLNKLSRLKVEKVIGGWRPYESNLYENTSTAAEMSETYRADTSTNVRIKKRCQKSDFML